jgi:hypothetical protein
VPFSFFTFSFSLSFPCTFSTFHASFMFFT